MNRKMDRGNDALYFRLTDAAIFESEEVQPGVILDFDEQGRVVGVEMLALAPASSRRCCVCSSLRRHSYNYLSRPSLNRLCAILVLFALLVAARNFTVPDGQQVKQGGWKWNNGNTGQDSYGQTLKTRT